jgi:hypothetical protein
LGAKDGAREKEVCEKKGGEYLCLGIIIQEDSTGFSDSGKAWLEGDLRCHQWKKFLSRLPHCLPIYRNPDGTPEKKNEYLFVVKDTITPFSPIN